MDKDFQEQDAIRYFLGELSETEQAAVEDRFFTDADFSDRLDEVETDLIDSYVRGELSAPQSQKFNEKFLVSERRRARVKAAAALWEKEKTPAPAVIPQTATPTFWENLKSFFSFPQLAYASLGILLLALVGGIALFWQPAEIVKIGNENIGIEPPARPSPAISPATAPTRTPDEAPQNKNSQTAEPGPMPSPDKRTEAPRTSAPPEVRQAPPVMAQFGLSSSSLRSGGNASNEINLKAGTESVYLRLKFKTEEEFEKYRIELRDDNGNTILSRDLKNKNALGIKVSARKLRRGNYKITLRGAKAKQDFEDLDFYDFSVEKK